MKRIQQTFPVKMFDNTKGPLKMHSELPEIVKKLTQMGKKSRPSEIKTPPIFSRFESNIVTVAIGGPGFHLHSCNTGSMY